MEVPYLGYEQLGYGANFNIALNMPLEQLKFYCVSNELFRKICSDQEFWHQRLQNEYPNSIQYNPENMTYGQYYNSLNEGIIKTVVVIYVDKILGSIPMFSADTQGDIYQRAINKLIAKNINFDPNKTSVQPVKLQDAKNIDSPGYILGVPHTVARALNMRVPVRNWVNDWASIWDNINVILIVPGVRKYV
jgi:hypothetical protein